MVSGIRFNFQLQKPLQNTHSRHIYLSEIQHITKFQRCIGLCFYFVFVYCNTKLDCCNWTRKKIHLRSRYTINNSNEQPIIIITHSHHDEIITKYLQASLLSDKRHAHDIIITEMIVVNIADVNNQSIKTQLQTGILI